MMNANALLVEQIKFVNGFGPAAPSTSVGDYVSLKGYEKCTIYIQGLNGTTVTGSAVTIKQASAVANTGEKALAFDYVWANLDTAATDTLVKTAVTSNTFTTLTTNSKPFQYVMEVKGSSLDTANSFDCIRVGVADAANTSIAVVYMLWPCKYGGATPAPSAILD